MTIHSVSPNDPRFGAGKNQPRLKPLAKAQRCARGMNCETSIDVSGVSDEQLPARLLSEGFIQKNGKWYCSKRCAALSDYTQPVANPSPNHKPLNITRVSVADLPGDGRTVRWVVCDLWECATRIEAPLSNDTDAVARTAVASGFVQYTWGTFCSHHCARRAKAAIHSGRQDPVDLHEAVPAVAAVADKSVAPAPPRVDGLDSASHPRVAVAKPEPSHAPVRQQLAAAPLNRGPQRPTQPPQPPPPNRGRR